MNKMDMTTTSQMNMNSQMNMGSEPQTNFDEAPWLNMGTEPQTNMAAAPWLNIDAAPRPKKAKSAAQIKNEEIFQMMAYVRIVAIVIAICMSISNYCAIEEAQTRTREARRAEMAEMNRILAPLAVDRNTAINNDYNGCSRACDNGF